MPSTETSKNIKLLNGGPLDGWWGPYESVAAACAAIPNQEGLVDGVMINFRMGKTVGIITIDGNLDYHWPKLYTDAGLVLKKSDVANASITREKIASQAVSAEKTSFLQLVIGKNKFNKAAPDNSAYGKYVNSATGLVASPDPAFPNFWATGYIAIKPSTQYTVSYKNQLAWYDADKIYISGNASTNQSNITQVSPANAAFLRCTVDGLPNGTGAWATFQVEEGAIKTAFEPYSSVFQLKDLNEMSIQVDALTSSLLSTIINAINAQLSIATNQINNKAVTIDKSEFFETQLGKNRFNIAAADNSIYGKYILASTGVEVSANPSFPDFWATGYIPVLQQTQYYLSNKNQIAWYNSSKIFISGDASLNSSGGAVTSPAGAAYLRCSVPGNSGGSGGWLLFQVELGNAKTAYEAYNKKVVLKSATENIYANGVTDALLTSIIASVSSGLLINTAQLADKSVSAQKANFLKTGRNLFNSKDSDNIEDKYVEAATGILRSVNQYYLAGMATGYIPVKPLTQYSLSFKNQIAWYNASKVFISGDSSTSPAGGTYSSPAGAAYLRCTVDGVPTDSRRLLFMVAEGAVIGQYEPYNLVMETPEGTPIAASSLSFDAIQALFQKKPLRPAIITNSPKIYIPVGQELKIYYENIHKYYSDYIGKTEINITESALTGFTDVDSFAPKINGDSTELTPQGTGTITARANVADEEYNLIILNKSSSIIVVDPAKNTDADVMLVGDSYSQIGAYTDVIRGTAANKNLRFHGLKKGEAASTATIKTQGNGGWRLADYFINSKVTLSPFMHPSTSHKYYGITSHWIDAHSANPSYLAKDYLPTVKALFDPATGLKLAPAVDDVMYVSSLVGYRRWDGAAWVNDVTEASLAFTFNFAKYRSTWGISALTILHILLGTNDWSNSSESEINTNWPAWKVMLDQFIASVKADLPNIKIAIGIPVSSGKQGDVGRLLTEKRKRAFWIHAFNLTTNYSGKESQNIHIVDYHSCVDRVYAYPSTDKLPYSGYTGTKRKMYLTDWIHLGTDGWKQMGRLFMGIIQFLR